MLLRPPADDCVNQAPGGDGDGGALAGLRIAEIGDGFAAAYAAKLLADLGADVVKIEQPGGDPMRRLGPFLGGRVDPDTGGLFLYFNANKRSVVLDVDDADDRNRLRLLLDRSDVLIHDLAPDRLSGLGLDGPALRRTHPRLVATSITPFGLSGPYRHYRARDLNLWNGGGIAYLNGGGPGTEELPPLAAFGRQASFQAGLNAAIATLGVVYDQKLTGVGDHVELSAQECLVAILEMVYPYWPYCGLVGSRLGRKPIQPVDFFECRDGLVYLCAIEEHQWRSCVDAIGSPEWAELEVFGDRLQRAQNWDVLRPLLAEWMATQTVDQLYRQFQQRRVPIAPVSTMGDLFDSEHLRARGFFATLSSSAGAVRVPGAPYRLSATPWRLRRPAPRLGEHGAEIWTEAQGSVTRSGL
jgi:crotonobetainyl-CoA:carnitine CoA-transferase CaiB-like acyl-CoA transferase